MTPEEEERLYDGLQQQAWEDELAQEAVRRNDLGHHIVECCRKELREHDENINGNVTNQQVKYLIERYLDSYQCALEYINASVSAEMCEPGEIPF